MQISVAKRKIGENYFSKKFVKRGIKSLEKFGRFSETDSVQDAPAMNEHVMNDAFPEATVSSPSQPKATVPPQESTDADDDFTDNDVIIEIDDSDNEEANMNEFNDSLFWDPSDDTTPRQQSALKSPQSDSVNDRIPPSTAPTTATLNEPTFEDQNPQPESTKPMGRLKGLFSWFRLWVPCTRKGVVEMRQGGQYVDEIQQLFLVMISRSLELWDCQL
ncbi:hypothetical protein LXL04_005270 [Taraxacum kok-saghyz]